MLNIGRAKRRDIEVSRRGGGPDIPDIRHAAVHIRHSTFHIPHSSTPARRVGGAVVALVAAAALSWAAPQQPPDRLTALQREAESLARQERTLLGELRQLEVERDLKTEQVRRADEELKQASRERDDATARIAALEGRIADQSPGLAGRLVELSKLGRPGYARLLLDADNVRDVRRAYRTVSMLVEADRRRASDFRRTVEDLRRTERTLVDRVQRITAVQAEAVIARQAAARAVARHAALITSIDARRDLTAQMIGELQAARQKLAGLTPAQPAAASASVANALPLLASLRGSLDWPATGWLASRFGAQRDPRYGTTTVRAGIEIAAAAGTPAAAIHDGVVAYADPFTGFGNLVIVDHGSQAYSLYGYLDSVAVTRGARVTRGQPVGTVGQSPAGKSGLYFELRIDGKAVDPVQWLKKR